MTHTFPRPLLAGAFALALLSAACAEEDPSVAVLQQADKNHDGVLSAAEVSTGLRRQLGVPTGKETQDLRSENARFRKVFGPGPTWTVQELASHPYFNPKIFGLLKEAPPEVVDTIHKWVPVDPHPFRLRRSFTDFLEDNKDAAKGALISYTNDFNEKSEQWAFHGVVGLNLHQKRNVHLGEDAKGVRPPVDTTRDAGIMERWFVPSIAWDKVTTSQSDRDEIDSLIYRLTTGFRYAGSQLTGGVLDGFRFNMSASCATDSDHRTSITAGELDIHPVKIGWETLGVGLNSSFQRVGIFGLRPELVLHAEGGTVTDDGNVPKLVAQQDFLRLGYVAGLGVRFEQVTGRFRALRGLTLHAGLHYLVDVTNSGPDVDLFTASADWALDDDGDYTLSAEYRNGRAPLVLDRYNDLTVGLSVRF